jgi:hypothetical protein
MDLPPGPRAPAAWQTVAWMARPGAFLAGVHKPAQRSLLVVVPAHGGQVLVSP